MYDADIQKLPVKAAGVSGLSSDSPSTGSREDSQLADDDVSYASMGYKLFKSCKGGGISNKEEHITTVDKGGKYVSQFNCSLFYN